MIVAFIFCNWGEMVKPVNLAILGLGTVGAGALRLLQENAAEITRRTGREIRITHVGVRRPRPDLQLDGIVASDDLLSIARADNVDIVVELIGGTTLARDLVLRAIANGKHVITANKALIANARQ
jgi:homoserine dehydrogenase